MQTDKRIIRFLALWFIGVGLISTLAVSCGSESKGSGSVHAIYVTGPSGVDCYAIIDEAGKAVGGNCVK